ncbi:sulfide/dihydroorotate dehydrogenase-like FAD/NAD-binding protein [Candidatus Woesearchaeota archaeon]|nr:sulfide/dihydroorotate dehydrogenase-like FAD/NAD-binding protein [Candidatus Woesearchaeota archaeon]
MHQILKKEKLAENIYLMEIEAPDIAKKARAGQFVILRIDENAERIPLTIVDAGKKAVTIIFQAVGRTTNDLAKLRKGNAIPDFTGPLGNPARIQEFGHVCLVGGGVGAAEVYPVAREMKKAKNQVTIIFGTKTKKLLFWEDRLKKVSNRLIICTDDGSKGKKGFVTNALKDLMEKEHIDYVVAIGPTIMMRFISKLTKDRIKTAVSLNPIMVDGVGMCGSCRVVIDGRVKFACVDGPEFNGHEVDWDELLNRNKLYLNEEEVCKQQNCTRQK